jgi:hypothetical protein
LEIKNAGRFEAGEFIEAEAKDRDLVIENNLERSVYYLVIEREIMARVLFDLSVVEENIKSLGTKSIILKDIFGYENRGDQIVIKYWTNKDPDSDEIKNIIIDTD